MVDLGIAYCEILDEDETFILVSTPKDGICMNCKDHASVCRCFNLVDGKVVDEDEPSSDCCGSDIHIF